MTADRFLRESLFRYEFGGRVTGHSFGDVCMGVSPTLLCGDFVATMLQSGTRRPH